VHPLTPAGDVCEDPDADGKVDALDNCPDWANSTQAMPNWPVPAGDSDCDGFPDRVAAGLPNPRASETFLGTDLAGHCAATPVRNDEPPPDAWPPDFDNNQLVNGQDLLMFAPHFGVFSTDPRYNVRFDLSGDGTINGVDLLKLAPFFGKMCTP